MSVAPKLNHLTDFVNMPNLFKKIFRKNKLPKKWLNEAKSQNKNKENLALRRYAEKFRLDRSFVEFGFHTFEYNSVGLTQEKFKGLLLDSDSNNCDLANSIFKSLRLNSKAVCHWITIDDLDPILSFVTQNNNKLGILNVDIDGNDYWVLKEILKSVQPELICVEYNASFGLHAITVPYSENFDRRKMHKDGLYHGASISAFFGLLKENYYLIENIAGLNLIFVRKDKKTDDVSPLSPEAGYQESELRNAINESTAAEQWKQIEAMDYVFV